MTRGYGRVGREHALVAHGLDVLGVHLGGAVRIESFVKQFHGEKRRVSLVHVELGDVVVAERSHDAYAADAEDDLLAEPVALVAAVELAGEQPVLLGIGGQVGINEVYGNQVVRDATHLVPPGAQFDVAFSYVHVRAGWHFLEVGFRVPNDDLFPLVPVLVETLVEIAFAMEKAHRDQGHPEVRGGSHGIAGQASQAAAVGRHLGLQRDLHREIGNDPFVHPVVPHRFGCAGRSQSRTPACLRAAVTGGR